MLKTCQDIKEPVMICFLMCLGGALRFCVCVHAFFKFFRIPKTCISMHVRDAVGSVCVCIFVSKKKVHLDPSDPSDLSQLPRQQEERRR